MNFNFNNLVKGKFLRRVNRFIAEISLENNETVLAHLANTGRMSELLIKDRAVLLSLAENTDRKTKFNLLFIKNQNNRWILLKANEANELCYQWLLNGYISEFRTYRNLKREFKVNNSRFDFYLEKDSEKWLLEVKSVNYFKDGIAIFPDAPTKRGNKHITELIALSKEGYRVGIIFVLMGENARVLCFNESNDPDFVGAIKVFINDGFFVKAFRSDFDLEMPFYGGELNNIGE